MNSKFDKATLNAIEIDNDEFDLWGRTGSQRHVLSTRVSRASSHLH
jgi:hypothetical protein